jgi:hypothetical protein
MAPAMMSARSICMESMRTFQSLLDLASVSRIFCNSSASARPE